MQEVARMNVTTFSPNGDRKILVGSEDAPQVFMVSSHVMAHTGKAWIAMFGPESPFISTESSSLSDGMIEISMPDDNVGALKILLSAAHLKYKMIPKAIPFDDLVHIAILADKYDLAELLLPWVGGWVKHVQEYDSEIIDDCGWLFVAWSFGIASIFKRVTNMIILHWPIVRIYLLGQKAPQVTKRTTECTYEQDAARRRIKRHKRNPHTHHAAWSSWYVSPCRGSRI